MTDSSTTKDGSDDVKATEATEITYEIGIDEPPSNAVVRATAALTDRPVIELDPLFDVVDPDHLDGVFNDTRGKLIPEESSVTFTFNGCHVSLSDEEVVVRLLDQTTE